ncbi:MULTISPECIES: ABC transporter ATP-binding protein [Streptomyces]|uniref:ABC transporter ATP-binding protein n=1 Tax=Streptomyces TaxID=1883 RepID=UPI001D05050D|nr:MULTISPECIES: ABC transporter ATP-binding protein [Streptomyces]
MALLLMLAEAAAAPVTALVLGSLTEAVSEAHASEVLQLGLLVSLLVIVGLTGNHFAHVLYFELGAQAFLSLDRELIDLSNGSAGIAHHENAEYSDRITVLHQELNRISSNSMVALWHSISLAIGVVCTTALLVDTNPWLLFLPFAVFPPVLLGRQAERIISSCRHRMAHHTRAAQHIIDLARGVSSAKELRVLGLRSMLQSRHAESWREITRGLWLAELRATVLRVAGQLIFAVAYIAGTLLVVRAAVQDEASVGDVVLVIVLAAQVNQQATTGVTLLREFQRLAETLADLRWIRALVGQRPSSCSTIEAPSRLIDGFRLRDVSFHYEGSDVPVLRDVNLHLPAGAMVGIVGENGAGKSTLVKLLCRFYAPSTGVIEVDGTDIHRLDVLEWHSAISVGFQDFSRFELTAGRTVGVGDLPRLDDRRAVEEALDRTRASDIVDQLPDGLGTRLGRSFSDGTELSGGQWQKMALGRTMMRRHPVLLILDEPTSALDAQAEYQLFRQYAESARTVAERAGAVTVLVSHRFSTVRMADLIIVLSGNTVAESGTHAALIAADGVYASLYRLQADQYD